MHTRDNAPTAKESNARTFEKINPPPQQNRLSTVSPANPL
jgi:hypothetical protein